MYQYDIWIKYSYLGNHVAGRKSDTIEMEDAMHPV